MTAAEKPKLLRFQVALPKVRQAPLFVVQAESEYAAAQGVAKILKNGYLAERQHGKEGVWQLYRHSQGDNWYDAQTFKLTQLPSLKEKRVAAAEEARRLSEGGTEGPEVQLFFLYEDLKDALDDQLEAVNEIRGLVKQIEALKQQLQQAKEEQG